MTDELTASEDWLLSWHSAVDSIRARGEAELDALLRKALAEAEHLHPEYVGAVQAELHVQEAITRFLEDSNADGVDAYAIVVSFEDGDHALTTGHSAADPMSLVRLYHAVAGAAEEIGHEADIEGDGTGSFLPGAGIETE